MCGYFRLAGRLGIVGEAIVRSASGRIHRAGLWEPKWPRGLTRKPVALAGPHVSSTCLLQLQVEWQRRVSRVPALASTLVDPLASGRAWSNRRDIDLPVRRRIGRSWRQRVDVRARCRRRGRLAEQEPPSGRRRTRVRESLTQRAQRDSGYCRCFCYVLPRSSLYRSAVREQNVRGSDVPFD